MIVIIHFQIEPEIVFFFSMSIFSAVINRL